jgi:hypothetical protein
VTQPLFSNSLSSQQQRSEVFIPNKVKLEPINRSQLQIKSSNGKHAVKEEVDGDDDDDDDQEPVNMSTKEELNDEDDEDEHDDDDVDEDEEEHRRQSTRNLLTNVSSPVHA